MTAPSGWSGARSAPVRIHDHSVDERAHWPQQTYRYQGRDFRLTDVHGQVVRPNPGVSGSGSCVLLDFSGTLHRDRFVRETRMETFPPLRPVALWSCRPRRASRRRPP